MKIALKHIAKFLKSSMVVLALTFTASTFTMCTEDSDQSIKPEVEDNNNEEDNTPDQEVTTSNRLPEFSFDSVPRAIYCTSKDTMTDEECQYAAEHFDWIVFANNNGKNDYDSYDIAIVDLAQKMKVYNQNIKVIFYWNAARCVESNNFEGNTRFNYDEWDLQTNGTLGKGVSYTSQDGAVPDITIEACREWWITEAKTAMCLDGVDGIWIDAAARHYNTSNNEKWVDAGLWEDTVNSDGTVTLGAENLYLEMYKTVYEFAVENEKFMVGNFLRPENTTDYEKMWPYFDASYVEDHYSGEDIDTYREAILGYTDDGIDHKGLIVNMADAISKGKMLLHLLGLDGEDYDNTITNLQSRIDRAPFDLAVFLLTMDQGVYLNYMIGSSSRDTNAWNKIEAILPELDYPLGEPQGAAVVDSSNKYIYTREFEHASLKIDLSDKDNTNITWF